MRGRTRLRPDKEGNWSLANFSDKQKSFENSMGFGMDSEAAPCELLGFIKTLRPYQALQFNALSLCITKKETHCDIKTYRAAWSQQKEHAFS